MDSKEFAVLLEWNNIYYDESPKLINSQKCYSIGISPVANASIE
jgi:hypothetical protein